MSEQFEADYKLTRNLELLTDKLQQTYRELDTEKKKTDQWVLKKCYGGDINLNKANITNFNGKSLESFM